MNMALVSNKRFMGVFSLTMINVAAIVNLSSTPSMAAIGLGFISYFMLAAIFFFLPTAFIAAELSTAWPLPGGLYDWVKLAFGPHIGFLAVWLQWITNIIWYPTLLITAIAGVTDLFSTQMAINNAYLFSMLVGVFWFITFLNLKGMKNSSLISSIGVMLGIILPSVMVIIFAIVWIFKGQPIGFKFTGASFIPHLNNLNNISLLVALLVTLVGMEMSVVHSDKVATPRATYPKAIFFSITVIMLVFVFVSGALTVIVPPEKIDVVVGFMQVIQIFCNTMHIGWLTPIVGILISLGILTIASTWISGPSKGLRIASFDTEILHFLEKTNKHDMPSVIMILQAIFFTLLTSVFLFIPSIKSSYWILIALTGQLYMAMYFIMFLTGICLRYKYPLVLRDYFIPGKYHSGMWLMAILGVIGSIFSFILTYFQPTDITTMPEAQYVKILLFLFCTVISLPLIISCITAYHRFRNKIAEPAEHQLSSVDDFTPEQKKSADIYRDRMEEQKHQDEH